MEYWDAYNENRKKLGYDLIRDVSVFKENEYHIVEEIWIINSKGEILLTQRSKNKKSNPLKWECTAGSILKGETSYQGALRELKEEIGLNLNLKDLIYFGNKVDKTHHAIVDKWVVRKDINLSDLVFSDGEVQDAKYVTKEEFERMLENGEIRDIFYYMVNMYEKIVSVEQRESYNFLGKEVEVVFDRKMGTHHPKYDDMIYELNYGYVPNTKSSDGEEIDVYQIDSKIPLETFKGKCIGIIQRINDEDDKLIVVDINNNKKYTEDDIVKIVNFAEKYFSSMIILI